MAFFSVKVPVSIDGLHLQFSHFFQYHNNFDQCESHCAAIPMVGEAPPLVNSKNANTSHN